MLEGGEVSPWFIAALILGPLVRYENFDITLPLVALLFLRGHRRDAVLVLVCTLAITVGFSLFLHHLGLGLLPNSVVAKSGGMHYSFRRVFMDTPWANIFANPWIVAFQLSLVAYIFTDKRGYRAGLIALIALWLHLTFGRYGWFDRYECYVNGFLLTLAFQSKTKLLQWPPESPVSAFVAIVSIGLGWLVLPTYVRRAQYVPIDANNIRVQQLQMHRFVVDYWKGSVAVNDLGWVSWQNPFYVLDLYGLGNSKSLQYRMTRSNSAWMDVLCKNYKVRLCMLYETWFPTLPPTWTRVGTLTRPGQDNRTAVSFFVTDPAAAPIVRAELAAFRSHLPKGATITLDSIPASSATL